MCSKGTIQQPPEAAVQLCGQQAGQQVAGGGPKQYQQQQAQGAGIYRGRRVVYQPQQRAGIQEGRKQEEDKDGLLPPSSQVAVPGPLGLVVQKIDIVVFPRYFPQPEPFRTRGSLGFFLCVHHLLFFLIFIFEVLELGSRGVLDTVSPTHQLLHAKLPVKC